jgi:hypothetical protein
MPRMTRFADELSSCRFPASVADWTRRGIPRTTLTGPRFTRTAYGWYRRAGPPRSTAQRILDALAGQVDGALIAGWAAAYVHGVDLLDGLDDHTMAPLPVPVLLPPGQRRRSTRHIPYRQSRRPAHQERIERVPVTTLFRAALDLALLAPELTEAVVALDAVLASRLLAHQRLQRVAADLPRRRGVRQARRAIELARIGVRSPWESRLRMFAETELAWTDLQPNRAVFDHRGNLLGIPDLLDVEAGLVLEYDGASWRTERSTGHRDLAQHREDNEREERLERAGLVVVRVAKADLTRYRDRLALRLTAAHAEGLGRDRARDRWTLEEPAGWFGQPA